MTVSPFDHPYLSGLLGDEEVTSLFSAAAELEAMLAFEVALAKAEAAAGVSQHVAGALDAGVLLALVPDEGDAGGHLGVVDLGSPPAAADGDVGALAGVDAIRH